MRNKLLYRDDLVETVERHIYVDGVVLVPAFGGLCDVKLAGRRLFHQRKPTGTISAVQFRDKTIRDRSCSRRYRPNMPSTRFTNRLVICYGHGGLCPYLLRLQSRLLAEWGNVYKNRNIGMFWYFNHRINNIMD